MPEEFTEEARRVLAHAREEAQRFRHPHIGTEHILLGLYHEGGPAGRALEAQGLTVERLALEMEKVHDKGILSMVSTPSDVLPLTRRAERLLDHAREEARALRQEAAAPAHLLLGLLRQRECGAARMLLALRIDPGRLREAVLRTLSRPPSPPI